MLREISKMREEGCGIPSCPQPPVLGLQECMTLSSRPLIPKAEPHVTDFNEHTCIQQVSLSLAKFSLT